MDIKKLGISPLAEPKFLDASDITGIRQEFECAGVAFFENATEENLVKLSIALGSIVKPRNQINSSGVSNIRCAPGLVGKGYSSQELFFHTDRSGWDHPPRLLLTTLQVKAESGGESLFINGDALRCSLSSNSPELFSLLTDKKHSSFRADDGTFIPRPIFDLATGILRFRFDDGIQFSGPLVELMDELKSTMIKHSNYISLSAGQAYIADNHRFLHGRTRFAGTRELLRILAYPHPAPKPKLMLWDVDGTLCRAEAASIDAFYPCIGEIVGKEVTPENTNVHLHGVTDLSLTRAMMEHHGVNSGKIPDYTERFMKRHPEYLAASFEKGLPSTPCVGAKAAVDYCTALASEAASRPGAATVISALCTGNSRFGALEKISRAGFDASHFDIEVSAFGDTHVARPALVEAAMKSFGKKHGHILEPRNVLIIGDTPLDVDCARQVGTKVIAVATGHYSKDRLEALNPDLAVPTLDCPEAQEFIRKFVAQ